MSRAATNTADRLRDWLGSLLPAPRPAPVPARPGSRR